MTPNSMQARAQQILAIYDQAEIRLLEILKKDAVDSLSSSWAKKKAREIRKAQETFRQIVDEVSKIGGDQAKKLLKEAFTSGGTAFLNEARALGIDVPNTLIPNRIDRLLILQDEMDGKINSIGGAVLRDVNDKYREIVGESLGVGLVNVENREQLMQRALNKFAEAGIYGFVDRAGRRWGMGEYTEMATRTGMMNSALAGYAAQAQQYGVDLVIITDHSDECPLCRPWENKVLSLTGSAASDPECEGTIDQARSAGLFHPNCLHSYSAYVSGLTIKGGGDRQSESRNAEGYVARQTQRYYERQLRRIRRVRSVAMDGKALMAAQGRISELESAIEAIMEKYNTQRRPQRERPYKAVTIGGRKIEL